MPKGERSDLLPVNLTQPNGLVSKTKKATAADKKRSHFFKGATTGIDFLSGLKTSTNEKGQKIFDRSEFDRILEEQVQGDRNNVQNPLMRQSTRQIKGNVLKAVQATG